MSFMLPFLYKDFGLGDQQEEEQPISMPAYEAYDEHVQNRPEFKTPFKSRLLAALAGAMSGFASGNGVQTAMALTEGRRQKKMQEYDTETERLRKRAIEERQVRDEGRKEKGTQSQIKNREDAARHRRVVEDQGTTRIKNTEADRKRQDEDRDAERLRRAAADKIRAQQGAERNRQGAERTKIYGQDVKSKIEKRNQPKPESDKQKDKVNREARAKVAGEDAEFKAAYDPNSGAFNLDKVSPHRHGELVRRIKQHEKEIRSGTQGSDINLDTGKPSYNSPYEDYDDEEPDDDEDDE